MASNGSYLFDTDQFTRNLVGNIKNPPNEFFPILKSPLDDTLSSFGEKAIVGPGLYVTVGGPSGSGKSGFVNQYFVYNQFLYWERNRDYDLRFLYYLTERGKKFFTLRAFSWFLYVLRGAEITIPMMVNAPNRKRDITKADLQLIDEVRPVVAELLSRMTIIDDSAPSLADMERYDKGFRDKYPDSRIIRILDTANNTDEKDRVASISDQSRICRDQLNMFVLDVNQFNRSLEDTYRLMKMKIRVRKSDWYMSSKFDQNADLMIGLLNPNAYDTTRLFDYKVSNFNDPVDGHCRLRGAWCVKNSYGPDQFEFPLAFFGETSYFTEIPLGLPEDQQKYISTGIFNI
jgi:hypothetical protein